ncbi:MAG: YdeI/OmpD-associated family protein, partial [Actinobacteria bacterium]|nr:YdeI/OmpD-associated family protein [Actinomycetota bacterium]
SYSHQRQHAESVDNAKTDATRQRRIDRVVEAMRESLR